MRNRGPVAAILLAGHAVDGGFECAVDSDTIEAAIAVLSRCGIDELVVVMGERAGTLAFQIAAPVTTVRRDADWLGGWKRGVESGVAALQPDSVAIVLATAAIVEADARLLRRTIRRYHRGESGLFAFERDGAPSLPLLLDRRYRGLLLECTETDAPAVRIAAHVDGCILVAPGAGTPSPAAD